VILIALRDRRRKARPNAAAGATVLRPARRGIRATSGAAGAPRPLFSADDAIISALLIHLLPIVARKRPETWPSEALKVSQDLHRYFRRELTPFTSRIPSVMPELAGLDREELGVRLFARYVVEKMEVLACATGRYEPRQLRIESESHLRDALDRGQGAVLWCENSFSSSLLQKAAVAAAGYRVHHLSRPGHNLSSTRYGMRWLNPIVRKGENKYLAELILVDATNQLAVSRHIMQVLGENQVVSVTVNSEGSQAVSAPLFDGAVSVATGAPNFSLRSGAPLLPTLSYRDGQEYVVEIGEPISLAGMTREAACEYAVQELARRLDGFARAQPLDWCGWLRGAYSEPSGAGAGVSTGAGSE
jgi:lauroyl/myristoyl acyltransferase